MLGATSQSRSSSVKMYNPSFLPGLNSTHVRSGRELGNVAARKCHGPILFLRTGSSRFLIALILELRLADRVNVNLRELPSGAVYPLKETSLFGAYSSAGSRAGGLWRLWDRQQRGRRKFDGSFGPGGSDGHSRERASVAVLDCKQRCNPLLRQALRDKWRSVHTNFRAISD